MGNSGGMQEPPTNNVEDRLTVLPDYMAREEGDKVFQYKEYYNVCKVKNIGISECKTYLRLKFILAKYMKWTLDSEPKTINNGMYTIINHQLNGNKYNNIELLNDYHHLIFTHCDQFEDIYKYFQINCKISFCSSMMRNYRDRHNSKDIKNIREKLYFGFDSSKEINLIQILDKMHCHFLHTYEMGFDVISQDMIHVSDDIKYANKNFKVDGYIGYGELHEELSNTDINEIFKEKADNAHNDNVIRNTKKIVYEKSKTLNDLSIYQSQNGVNGFDLRENNKFVTNLHAAHVRETNEKEKKYTFGDRYSYWDYFEDEYWYIPNKYECLKDELLLNEPAPITLKQFNDLVEKSECYIKTSHCRKIMCTDKRGRPYYGIAKRELITIQHLISLFIYCNFNKLQRIITSTYLNTITEKKNNKFVIESNDELKLRHSVFHHIGKCIRESVEVFGINAYQSNINNYYHAINQQMIFIHNGIYVNSILSCTSKLAVAIYYCSPYLSESRSITQNNNDVDLSVAFNDDNTTDINNLDIIDDNTLILNFNSGSSFYYYSARYFDCSWLSEYANEMECLFVGNDKPLYIKSILYPSQSFNYKRYINGINIIKNMIRGLWYYSLSENDIVQKLLSFDDTIPKYIQNLFNKYRQNVFQIDINHEAMYCEFLDGTLCQKGYKFLKPFFYDEKKEKKDNKKNKASIIYENDNDNDNNNDDDDMKQYNYGNDNIFKKICYIKLQLFCDIFPNIKRIFISNIELSEKFIKCISEFLESKGSNNLLKHRVNEINVYNIIGINNNNEEEQNDIMNIDQYIEKYWQEFDDINYKMHKQSIYNDFLCFQREAFTIKTSAGETIADLW